MHEGAGHVGVRGRVGVSQAGASRGGGGGGGGEWGVGGGGGGVGGGGGGGVWGGALQRRLYRCRPLGFGNIVLSVSALASI